MAPRHAQPTSLVAIPLTRRIAQTLAYPANRPSSARSSRHSGAVDAAGRGRSSSPHMPVRQFAVLRHHTHPAAGGAIARAAPTANRLGPPSALLSACGGPGASAAHRRRSTRKTAMPRSRARSRSAQGPPHSPPGSRRCRQPAAPTAATPASASPRLRQQRGRRSHDHSVHR
jgi:hypothetical protein